jgi:hypothetical protein
MYLAPNRDNALTQGWFVAESLRIEGNRFFETPTYCSWFAQCMTLIETGNNATHQPQHQVFGGAACLVSNSNIVLP